MKFFILLHNQIMMAQSTIYNSVEQWFPVDVEEVQYQLRATVANYHANKMLTNYQRDKLLTLIDGITYNG